MAFVTAQYYEDTFMGIPVEEFTQYNAWAERAIALITRGKVTESNFSTFPDWVQEAYKNAICAQISYLAEAGLTTAINGETARSFTVGKVRVDEGGSARGGAYGAASSVCALAKAYLEQTGLLYPAVGVIHC